MVNICTIIVVRFSDTKKTSQMPHLGKILQKKDYIEIEVPVLYFEEDGLYYANLPAFDLMGYGKTEDEAKASLEVMVHEFIKDAQEDNILEKELLKLGWQKLPKMQYPQLWSDIISNNDQIRNIINNKSVRTDRMGVNVPAFA